MVFEKDLCEALSINVKEYRKRVKEINRIFKISNYTTEDYLLFLWYNISLPPEVLKECMDFYRKMTYVCVSPSVLAGSIVYLVDGKNERTTQKSISDILNITEVSIRNTVKLLNK